MTIKEALQTIADEFGPFDRDEFQILEDIITTVVTTNYREGWAAGYADSLDDSTPDWDMEL